MENKDISESNGKPAYGLAERTINALKKEYILIGKTRIHSWHAWLTVGLVAGITIGIFLVSDPNVEFVPAKAKINTQSPLWENYNDLVSKGVIKKANDVLEMTLSYNSENASLITIEDINKKVGYVPKYETRDNGYMLEIINVENNSLYSLIFGIPNEINDPPPLEGEKIVNRHLTLKQVSFTLTVPWFNEAKELRVLGPDTSLLATASLDEISSLQNKSNFNSIRGDKFIKQSKKNSLNLNKFISPVLAQNDPDYLDITFIGDDYLNANDLNIFHNDVNNFINHLLSYEPFKSRAAQIYFHYVDNTADLGCTYSGRVIICDNTEVTQQVNNSGVPYDKIAVIVNNSTYGGSGGYISVAYNGSYGPQVFVHEFGHSLGSLLDEYNLYAGGTIDNQIRANCYAGTPPASAWANIVAINDYALGCKFSNWYRSYPNSIMLALNYAYFNTVSQILLNQKLDYFAGQFTDNLLPTSAIISPGNETVVSGTVTIKTSLSDNNGIARAELWKDEILFHSEYINPFQFSWPTTNETDGTHTLIIKAYDTAGNIGKSATTTVIVNNSADITAPTVSITSPQNESELAGLINIYASASDNSGTVSKVEFYIDGILLGNDSTNPFAFLWDTTNETNGSHTLQAKAYDPSNNIGISFIIAVSVNNLVDNITPTVSITYPQNGTTLSAPSKITITANASDNIGVSLVEFYINGSLACSDATLNYSCNWRVPATKNATYILQTRAYDAAGNSGASSNITVTTASSKPKGSNK